MWKFKETAEGLTREENLRKAKNLLDSLPAQIPAIAGFEVGIDILHSESSYDLVLNSSFENKEQLVAYQTHPAHVKVVEFLRKVQTAKTVVDYVV